MEDSANAGADGQEEVQEVQQTEAAPTEEHMVPKSRMDELNDRMKAAEEAQVVSDQRAMQYEQALQEANVRLQQAAPAAQQAAPAAELDEDQKYWSDILTPVLDKRLGHLEQNVQSVINSQNEAIDARTKDSFWSQYSGQVDNKVVNEVEMTLNNMRAQGQGDSVNRQDIMDYVVGRNRRMELGSQVTRAQATQQQVTQSNTVAKAEGGSTTVAPPENKNLETMTADEIIKAFGNETIKSEF